MASTKSTRRRAIPVATRRRLARFYDGRKCVVTGSTVPGRASHHHLDGDSSNSDFSNLVPLALDLHNGLCPGLAASDLQLVLRPAELKRQAEDHFRRGKLSHAYACQRLAYALSVHFYRKQDRNPDDEFRTVAHALYYLRRCFAQSAPEDVIANLSGLLEREIQPAIDSIRVIPPFGAFCLLVELASWLSECGWAEDGLNHLRSARSRLRAVQHGMQPADVSRLLRQLGNALDNTGQLGNEFETALRLALEHDPSDNSKTGVANTRLFQHLGTKRFKRALAVLEERFDHFEEITEFFSGDLMQMGSVNATSLGYIALSLICESQLIRTRKHRQRLLDRLEALKRQEGLIGNKTLLHRVPGLESAADSAAENLPQMHGFLVGRFYPILPKKVAASIQAIASQL